MKNELPNSQNSENQRLIRSFGRIKSRKLSDHKNHLLEDFFPNYQIKSEEISNKLAQKNILEIGFGFGDFLFEKAKNNTNSQFYGFEPHLNGVVNLLGKLEKEPQNNIKISTQDVRLALENFSEEFFDEIYILFPDPWPKIKHFKRRLINEDFLDNLLAKKMKSNGHLIIATDHDSYKIWILKSLLNSTKFNWLADSKKDWQEFPQNWTFTKYQKKAAKEGRVSIILKAQKI
jgi:tRNA (guanine-N7-)-methyltransferase